MGTPQLVNFKVVLFVLFHVGSPSAILAIDGIVAIIVAIVAVFVLIAMGVAVLAYFLRKHSNKCKHLTHYVSENCGQGSSGSGGKYEVCAML